MTEYQPCIYTREAQLEIFAEKHAEMNRLLAYEMRMAIGTEGEADVAKKAREVQKALYSFEQTIRLYHTS